MFSRIITGKIYFKLRGKPYRHRVYFPRCSSTIGKMGHIIAPEINVEVCLRRVGHLMQGFQRLFQKSPASGRVHYWFLSGTLDLPLLQIGRAELECDASLHHRKFSFFSVLLRVSMVPGVKQLP